MMLRAYIVMVLFSGMKVYGSLASVMPKKNCTKQQEVSRIITGLRSLPVAVCMCIMGYLPKESSDKILQFPLDPRLIDLKKDFSYSVNDAGDIIFATKRNIVCWNPLLNEYKLRPVASHECVDRMSNGFVVLASQEKKKYYLNILSGKMLQKHVSVECPRYLDKVFEVSGDGSSLCYTNNPLLTKNRIEAIEWRKLESGVVSKITVAGAQYCMVPLIMSHNGEYVGARDVRTFQLVLWRVIGDNLKQGLPVGVPFCIETMPVDLWPIDYDGVLSMRLMKKTGLKTRKLHWLLLHQSPQGVLGMRDQAFQTLIKHDSSWRNDSGELLLDTQIAVDSMQKVQVRTITTATKKLMNDKADYEDSSGLEMVVTHVPIDEKSIMKTERFFLGSYHQDIEVAPGRIGCFIALAKDNWTSFYHVQEKLSHAYCVPRVDAGIYNQCAISSTGRYGIVGNTFLMMRDNNHSAIVTQENLNDIIDQYLLSRAPEDRMYKICSCLPICFYGLYFHSELARKLGLKSLCKKQK